jgi:hypothetical protein
MTGREIAAEIMRLATELSEVATAENDGALVVLSGVVLHACIAEGAQDRTLLREMQQHVKERQERLAAIVGVDIATMRES